MCPFDGNPTTYPTPVIPAQAPDKDAEILLGAANYLERNGWLQCKWGHGVDTPRCLLGAIAEASDALGGHGYTSARDRLGDDASRLIAWNNAKGRTAAEVIARLRSAARG